MNIKGKFLLVTLYLVSAYVYPQKVIEKFWDNHSLILGTIEKIILTDSTTVFHFIKTAREEEDTFKLPENLFIWTELDSLQYGLQKVEGITYDEIPMEKGKQIKYQLFFEPLPETSKSVQLAYYEDKNTIKGFKRIIREISGINSLQKSDDISESESIFSKLSFEKALKKAKEEDKKILLFFYDTYFSDYKVFEDCIFINKDVKAKLQEKYIVLKMNTNRKEANLLDKVYPGRGMRKLIILSSDGTLINNYSGDIKVKDFLRFIELEKLQEEKIFKTSHSKMLWFRLGARVMLMNSYISDYSSRMRTSVSSDIYLSTTFNGWYFFRTGLGFSSKGSCDTPINYLKMPLEFGVALHKGYLFDSPFTLRVVGGPYYALRVNKSNLGIAKSDYGFRFALAPNIGNLSELSLSLYYDYGVKDLFKNIKGFQRNHSFGIGISLTM
ncbi:thioredoxin family protein [Capnocytophaga stomatis]|uniref:thioredoxin family protein n=1 Tax=Capnocytophaga stomatis TaxID=1848904 RepID=UPI001AD177C9|nr:thioredoxin family protein [Capnocytophaga stomatis]GIM50017.1 hypothetical protein CAPN003_14690 [Capnocytophaga stomatis]